jgi:hypothetical protein
MGLAWGREAAPGSLGGETGLGMRGGAGIGESDRTSGLGCLSPLAPARSWAHASWTLSEAYEVRKIFTDPTVEVKSGAVFYCGTTNERIR